MKYAVVAAAVFSGDFFLKRRMEKQMKWEDEKEICRGRLVLRKHHNYGAALNVLEKCPGLVKGLCGGMLLVLGVFWLLLLRKKENPGLLLGLSLLVGGGASNLYDRVKRGYVVDYFSFRTPLRRLNPIVFNLSDLCIFLGGILTIFFGRRKC